MEECDFLSKFYFLNVSLLKKKVYLCAQLDLKQIKKALHGCIIIN